MKYPTKDPFGATDKELATFFQEGCRVEILCGSFSSGSWGCGIIILRFGKSVHQGTCLVRMDFDGLCRIFNYKDLEVVIE